MAPTIPTIEPERVAAGDTWVWKYSDPDFPLTEGWALSYALAGAAVLAWTAGWGSASGNVTTVTIPAATTTDLTAGSYEFTRIWTGSGTYAGRVHTVALPRLTILANPQTRAAGDGQTHAERTLAVLEAALEGRLTDDIEQYQIGGRAVSKIPVRELVALRATYRLEVWRQRHPGQAYPSAVVRFVGAA